MTKVFQAGVVTLYDILRLTGIFAGPGWALQAGQVSNASTWMALIVSVVVSVGAAWMATAATMAIAKSTKSELALSVAYLSTLCFIAAVGVATSVWCLSFRH